jgi:hypothetical protein
MRSPPPSLPPVPTPFRKRWREFRVQALPFIAFVVVGTVVASLWRQVVLPTQTHGDPSPCRGHHNSIAINDDPVRLNVPPTAGSQTNGIVDGSSPRD